jgi:TetR/AcrR family transcriptional repressor of nem operon
MNENDEPLGRAAAVDDSEPRTRRARADTRERLVDAATELMWKHGIGDVSVDMILERADVLKGSFYHFFSSKADLLLECLDNVWRRQAEQLAAIYGGAATPNEALIQHLQMLAQVQIDGNERLGFVPGNFNMSMPTPLLREDARIAGKLQELMDSNLHYLEGGLQKIVDSAGQSKSVKATARLLSYSVAGVVLASRMNNSLKPLDDFKLILEDALAGPVPAQPRTPRVRPDTRRRLVDAATELMWKHGIGDVSVDMILERADALKGSFYHYFPAKADLLLECLDNVWRQQAEQLTAIYSEAATPEEALTRHLQMLAQVQIDANDRLGFVPGTFHMSMPTSLLHEDARIAAKLQELMESNRHYLERGLRQIANARGLSRSVETTARLLSHRVAGAVLTARMNNSLKPLEDFRLILDNALAKPSTEN